MEIDYLLDNVVGKDKDIIKSKLPMGFENFPLPLQEIYVRYIQCQINASDIGNELDKLEEIINEKRRSYLDSTEKVREASDKIKGYFRERLGSSLIADHIKRYLGVGNN